MSLIKELSKELFACGGEFKALKVWDYRKQKYPVSVLPLDHQATAALLLRPGLVLVADRLALKVFDLRQLKQPVQTFSKQEVTKLPIQDMTFLNESELVLGASDRRLSMWQVTG